MAKPPAIRQPGPLPDKAASFEADFDRALAGNKNTARGRITAELRKLAEQDPEAFARGIRGLMQRDD